MVDTTPKIRRRAKLIKRKDSIIGRLEAAYAVHKPKLKVEEAATVELMLDLGELFLDLLIDIGHPPRD